MLLSLHKTLEKKLYTKVMYFRWLMEYHNIIQKDPFAISYMLYIV